MSGLPRSKSKHLAMLGLTDMKFEEEDEIAEKGLEIYVPKELEGSKVDKFTVQQLISYVLNARVSSMFEDDDKSDILRAEGEPIYQLSLDIKKCDLNGQNETTLLFSIFDDKRKIFLTEEHCLTLTDKNVPTVGEEANKKILFRDLRQEDLDKDLYIIGKIYRMEPLETDNNGKKKNANLRKVVRPEHSTNILSERRILFCAIAIRFNRKKKSGPFQIAPLSNGIAHSLTLYQGSCEEVEKSYSLNGRVAHVHPLEINPQIHSDRHELYVTLLDVHVNQRNKRSACNVMCKISLLNEDYQVAGMVAMGRGDMARPQSEGESPVFYHSNDPTINQTYVVSVPSSIKDLEKCHLLFSFWHTPATIKKMDERGFAFLPLFDPKLRQIKANKAYSLELYRMDKKLTGYLNNPILKSESKQIQVYLRFCSTKVLPDNDIHTFMTWEDQDPKILAPAMQRASRKAFEDVMQVFDEYMKVVFDIMSKLQKDLAMTEQSFFALVAVLGEVYKGMNMRFKTRIEEWIQNRFDYPGLWRVLADQLLKLLKWMTSDDAKKIDTKDASPDLNRQGAELSRQMLKSVRGIHYLFMLMKKSVDLEIQQDKESKARIQAEYEHRFNVLFDCLNRVMGLTEPRTVLAVQSFAIQRFLNLFASFPSQESQDIMKRTVKFIECTRNTDFENGIEKLLLIMRLLEHPKFSRRDVVDLFLPCLAKELTFHMSQSVDEQILCAMIIEKCVSYLDPKKPRTLKSIERNTVRVVHDGKGCEPSDSVLQHFGHLLLKYFIVLDNIRKVDLCDTSKAPRIFGRTLEKNPSKQEQELSIPSVESISTDQITIHRTFLVTIAEMARLLTGGTAKPETFSQKSERIDNVIKEEKAQSESYAAQLIQGVLQCCTNLLVESVFPHEWIFMRMVEAEIVLRTFSWFGATLQSNYMGKSFHKDLWSAWFDLGMLFLSHKDLALEAMTEGNAKLVREHYGDVRTIAIDQFRANAWNILQVHTVELAETMVPHAIVASTSEVLEIEEFVVDVYFQMLKSEFELTNEIKNVEAHTIDQVDFLTTQYGGNDEQIINDHLDFFRKQVNAKLANSKSELKNIGEQFIREIEKLYDYLAQLRKLPTDALHEDERTVATLNLLHYLEERGKVEMYNRHIHRLGLMHAQLGNSIEAGQCYMKHASNLRWSDRVLRGEPAIYLEEQTEWKRHVQLLENAYQQFQIGEAWEMAAKVCQELSRVYETLLFDFNAWSAQFEKEKLTRTFIYQHDRVFHSHFLLSFRGDFPSDLRGADFIYRSGRARNRIKAKWKDAKIINTSDPIQPEYESPDFKGQFIRIAKLNPSSPEEMTGEDFKWDKTKAPLRIKRYYREMELNTFYFTYGENEFRNLWIIQVYVIAEEVIPSIRRRIPVIKQIAKTLTPLQTAVNNLNTKTQELVKLVEACQNDPSHDIRSLSMSVNGVLDAAVMGGVAKYQEAFFDSDYFDEFPQERQVAEKFKEALRWQLEEAQKALTVYAKYKPENLADHVTHLEGCLTKMKKDLMEFLERPTKTT
ncbi:dedicator of cytokinesis protein 3 [Reticulomyxa filosa]|uniref:Dedicator of cytokinesis protein 3 n=1 Tax=Reticulomyxa filosa TaxID=46433 RepID=X6MTM5_RETFI|nr:dedicator of cytokinesis protein 3 [Reticulomyxa filosa]|eukprot:ETO17318.1 dedicator of cytokinesis protein 3 [Reticulomyxa filosa]